MEAAFEVFTARGYESTAISEVAAYAGIGQGTVYRYFGSKREILDHVIDFGVDKIMDSIQLPTLLGGSNSVAELIEATRAAVDRLYDLVDREPRVLRLVLVEAGAIDPELSRRLFGLEAIAASLIAGELARGVAGGWIDPDIDAQVLGHIIFGLVGPWIVRELLGGSQPEVRARTTRSVMEMLERVLPPRKAAS
ncbi:TetR/AcrR family transcriptional regulator [Nocardia sp. NPDC088792]|uniref:TetR/AcrR family transcriptional regulator n=1 Tax=Nocardia sp. NPDC088792 TaxID=3364332 RepID=UPI00381531CF